MELKKRINLITGHYGSGKTNLAINLALDERRRGKSVTLVDLDIVNPYFRTADFTELAKREGIRMVLPMYANSNLDLPGLTGAVDGVFQNGDDVVIFDVGGDDAGAIALGRYAQQIASLPTDFFYVVNRYRYLTRTPEETLTVLRDIQSVSRLTPTGVINCSNLGEETTAAHVEESIAYAREAARAAGLPLCCTCYDKRLGTLSIPDPYPMDIFVKKPWDK